MTGRNYFTRHLYLRGRGPGPRLLVGLRYRGLRKTCRLSSLVGQDSNLAMIVGQDSNLVMIVGQDSNLVDVSIFETTNDKIGILSHEATRRPPFAQARRVVSRPRSHRLELNQ